MIKKLWSFISNVNLPENTCTAVLNPMIFCKRFVVPHDKYVIFTVNLEIYLRIKKNGSAFFKNNNSILHARSTFYFKKSLFSFRRIHFISHLANKSILPLKWMRKRKKMNLQILHKSIVLCVSFVYLLTSLVFYRHVIIFYKK